MAYNNYFPMNYQPNYMGNANPYFPLQNQAMMQQAQAAQAQQGQPVQPVQQMQQPAIQQSGFVLVQSEQDARNYPVAPGNSITFKDERQPYCYVKTMGYNQLDPPTFERYRLVKEDSPVEQQNAPVSDEKSDSRKDTPYALKSDLSAIWGELDALKEKILAHTEKKSAKARKAVEEVDENE